VKVIYEYVHDECRHSFALMFPLGEAPREVDCACCVVFDGPRPQARRLLSRGNFSAFKGSYLAEVRG
jgi:predicted nucleic acid-binding Zn ribbon protein